MSFDYRERRTYKRYKNPENFQQKYLKQIPQPPFEK